MRIPSSDGVEVVVHDLGGAGAPLLFSHATGLNGHCYAPMAAELSDRYHSHALDYRGHGDTAVADDWQVSWEGYGDDATAVAAAIAPGGGLTAFGHSMGGATLLMAAHRDPGRFDLIVAFEPIAFPTDQPSTNGESSLAPGARRRRATFPSYEAAIENYRSKPPLWGFTDEALRAYVTHGFRPSDDGVTLKCSPEHEARTFEAGTSDRTWELLPDITTRVVVVAGKVEPGPSAFAAAIADRLPNGSYVELADLDHFGPMTNPGLLAELVAEHASR
jgi:pimeloyl-ACP methyl ester carboxylesterase